LPVEQVLPGEDIFNRAFVLGNLPEHAVTDNSLAFFATRVANDFAAIRRFHPYVAAVASDNQALL
jgi:hypothetical protein